MPLLLTKVAAAQELGVSRDVLRRLLDRGEIGVLMIEEEERIPLSELERFVSRRMEHRPCPSVAAPKVPGSSTSGSKDTATGKRSPARSANGTWKPSSDNGEPISSTPGSVTPLRP
jgi:excisionase family DNA binding protein